MAVKLMSDIMRCQTGTEGLDNILGGGLPRNRVYLVQGDPGVGKTTLAMQFLIAGAEMGETGLYITLSETKEELELVASSHGWKLTKIRLFELSAIEEKLKGETETTFFHPSEVELNRTTKILLDEVERVKPARVVFDSLSELRMLAETPLRYRRQILQLKQFFAGRKCTVLLLDDRSSGAEDLQIESISHGVISLHRTAPEYGVARRRVSIEKIRGQKYREGNHDMIIRRGGVLIFPRLVAAEHHSKFRKEAFSSGIKALDALLGGGLDRGTSNMFMGPPGSGKSTLAIQFALQAAKRGEKVLLFIFDETKENLITRTKGLDMDLAAFVGKGLIQIEQIDPAEISPGEMGHRISQAVLKKGVKMIILDSINGYLNAMPGERLLNLQLHELLAFLNQQGVITIMVLAQQGLVGSMQSSVDLTYLADSVILLRYFEAHGELRQALSVVKKRTGGHERTIREVKISKGGIEVGKPLTAMQGVLTGVPTIIAKELPKQEDGGKIE
ncbi:MAG TPA: ATPase domain-containing protein [Verrucomicrobiae bacterium]